MTFDPAVPSDHVLAATALLAPFEGVVLRNGSLTGAHIDGMASILTARSSSHPVTQLARDILDFHVYESAIMACVQDVPSSFESVPKAYLAMGEKASCDSDQAQLKAISKELFIRTPRLTKMVRLLRLQPASELQLHHEAYELSKSLLELQNPQAEGRLLCRIETVAKNNADAAAPIEQSVHFDSIGDFEALVFYWQGRLSLLRLDLRLQDLSTVPWW